MTSASTRTIHLATAAAAVLGAIPGPTAIANTAIQGYMLASLARTWGAPRTDAMLGAPLIARTAGVAAWAGLMKSVGPSPRSGWRREA